MNEEWQKLLDIMTKLRGEDGCPWDKEQDHQSLKRYLLEESYEVIEAIDNDSDSQLCDELGDLLLQVVFHAQIAAEKGRFSIEDVLRGINQKMIRRHPHVFGEGKASDSAEVLSQWEKIKSQEKKSEEKPKIMRVNSNLPALIFAQKVQEKASRVGFDWPDIKGPWAKLSEEIEELQAAAEEQRQEELGDVFFALVNLGRFWHLDSEETLRLAVKKFIRRFDEVERQVQKTGRDWQDFDLAGLDEFYNQAKSSESAKQKQSG
jgi:tetrapyrrole methylase family protein/MazG family protein